MMKLKCNGNVSIDDNDLEIFRDAGATVSMHTNYYANEISASIEGVSVGFYNWLDNLDFYIGDTQYAIQDEEQLGKALALMQAILDVKESLLTRKHFFDKLRSNSKGV